MASRIKPKTSQAATTIRRRLTSIKEWQLEPEPSSFAPPGSHWSNADMDPTPPDKRNWTTLVFVWYWISDSVNPNILDLASSIISGGLSWRQALVVIALGFTIISVPITLNGTIGAQTHCPFPVLNRSSFGFYLAYFPIISRVTLASFWFGIQTYTGGECMHQMLRAIWPSFDRIPNHLPASADITTNQMIAFFLYWLFQLPLRLRYLFIAKAIICPAALIAMMGWALSKGSGEIFSHHATLSGSAFTYAWLSGLNSVIGNYATLSVNIPDFTRYAPTPKSQYIQLLIIPPLFTFTSFIGIVITSAGYNLYGHQYFWDPLRLIANWDNRAATFFAAAQFALATTCTNISANSLSGANDLTAIAPRYINIKRGSFLVALIGGWAIPSWKILADASGFLNFMAGYTVFLGPFAAIMIADYFIVKRGRIDVPAMYNPHDRYHYDYGCNWRALVALILSVFPNLPGLAQSINTSLDVSAGWQHIYSLAWIYGFFSAGTVYSLLSTVFPPTSALGGDYRWGELEGEGIEVSPKRAQAEEDFAGAGEVDKEKAAGEEDLRAYETSL